MKKEWWFGVAGFASGFGFATLTGILVLSLWMQAQDDFAPAPMLVVQPIQPVRYELSGNIVPTHAPEHTRTNQP